MNTLLAYATLAVVLALVLRSMDGMTVLAASAGRLRPATVRVLRRAPMIAFGVWAATLLVRRAFRAEAATLWPFELAVAVGVWLCWIMGVALLVALHNAGAPLIGPRRGAPTEEAQTDPALEEPPRG